MTRKTFMLVMGLCSSFYCLAQTESYFHMEGQVAVTTNGEGLFLNFGGPALKFVFPKIALALNMMPSLRFQEDGQKSVVTPMLGTGPQIYFIKNKRFLLSFPCYYNTAKNTWLLTAGLGYVLSKNHK